MGEECHVECVITNVFRRWDFVAIYIHQVANRLESIEGYTYGKKKIIVSELGAKKRIAVVDEKVGVLEI